MASSKDKINLSLGEADPDIEISRKKFQIIIF